MQQYKKTFSDKSIKNKTLCNIQPCIRLKDLDEIGDGTHFLYFNMIGMFSFRGLTVKEGIDFWMKFISKLNLIVDTVTIHPDKMKDWKDYYKEYDVSVEEDLDCIWTDGESGGYCTEFYVNGIEIGNIVNNGNDSLDVGFGLERLEDLVGNKTPKTGLETLEETILKIIESGYVPGSQKQNYVLRKLLRMLFRQNGNMEHEFYYQEVERQKKMLVRYKKMKEKHSDKSKEWWYDTHGIDLDLV